MKRVDGLTGKKFLIGVLVAYFLTFFFSYFYFMAASPLIIGKSITNLAEEKYDPEVDNPLLIKTFSILGIVLIIFILVYVLPRVLHRKYMDKKKIKTQKYRAFKNR